MVFSAKYILHASSQPITMKIEYTFQWKINTLGLCSVVFPLHSLQVAYYHIAILPVANMIVGNVIISIYNYNADITKIS